jgi:hypothetical protein
VSVGLNGDACIHSIRIPIQSETLALVPRRQRTPGLNVPGGVDMLSRGVMRRDPWLVLTALTPELIGGAAFLEQQMDSISSKVCPE